MKIAVVGVGTMGSQVLWQLARSGHDVTGYELHSPGHSRGAAGGETRLFRTLQMEDPGYEPIADRSDELFRTLEAESGQTLRSITGALVMGDEDCVDMKAAVTAAERSEHPTRVLSREESLAEFPEFGLDSNDITVWDGHGGIIRPELTVATAARQAEALGARIFRNARVSSIRQRNEAVQIAIGEDVREYDRVVAAPGAWTNTLFPEMADLFEMRQLVSAWFFPEKPGHLDRVLPFIRARSTYAYGLPYADRTAMKLGLGTDSRHAVQDPDSATTAAPDSFLEEFREVAERYMPGLDPYPMRTASYFESYTTPGYEYVRTHPEMSNVIVMAGFSGHGFKMSPGFGEIGAALALGEEPFADLSFLQPHGARQSS